MLQNLSSAAVVIGTLRVKMLPNNMVHIPNQMIKLHVVMSKHCVDAISQFPSS